MPSRVRLRRAGNGFYPDRYYTDAAPRAARRESGIQCLRLRRYPHGKGPDLAAIRPDLLNHGVYNRWVNPKAIRRYAIYIGAYRMARQSALLQSKTLGTLRPTNRPLLGHPEKS